MPRGTPSREQKDTRYFRLGGLCGMDFGVFFKHDPYFSNYSQFSERPGWEQF